MKNAVKDENGLIRSRRHGPAYYWIGFGVSLLIVAVYYLIRKEFAWGKLGIAALVLGIVSVGWYFMDRMSVKQEDAMAREMEARKGGKNSKTP